MTVEDGGEMGGDMAWLVFSTEMVHSFFFFLHFFHEPEYKFDILFFFPMKTTFCSCVVDIFFFFENNLLYLGEKKTLNAAGKFLTSLKKV